MRTTQVSDEDLKDYLRYEPETGKFFWLRTTNNKNPVGSEAGCLSKNGYIYIGVRNKRILAHRLAIYFTTGRWPKITDHINRKRDDNRLCNLREVDDHRSNINKIPHKRAKSGFRGATMYSNLKRKKFRATAKFAGKQIHLGYFKTAEEAQSAYVKFYKSKGIEVSLEIKKENI